MKTTLMRFLAAISLVAAGSMLYTESANAFTLKLTDLGSSVTKTITDGSSEDSATSVAGKITLGNNPAGFTVGGYTINDIDVTALTKPFQGSAANPFMSINSLVVKNNSSAGDLIIEASEAGFTPNVPGFLTALGTGNNAGLANLSLESFFGNNLEFNKATSLAMLDGNANNFNKSQATASPNTFDPYSLTLEATVAGLSTGSSSGFTGSISQVPEPFTIMGSLVALGFGAYSKRKFKTHTQAN